MTSSTLKRSPSIACYVLALSIVWWAFPGTATAQDCLGTAATTGCRVNGRVGPCVGTAGDDRITGTDGNDVIVALGGDDHVNGGKGADLICGGDGHDRIRAGTLGSTIDGGAGDDRIDGGAGSDEIAGGGGDDRIDGGAGDDQIDGGAGSDEADGAAGTDTCVAEVVRRCEGPTTTTTTTTTTTSTTTSTTVTTTSSTTSTTLTTTTSTSLTTSTSSPPSTVTTTTLEPTCSLLDLTVHAGTGALDTETQLDIGSLGFGHNQDLPDGARIAFDLEANLTGTCDGEVEVTGINPMHGNCRCATDNSAICDEPYAADADDCGGGQCICYLTPPISLSAGGVPGCLVPRLAHDINGIWDVPTGAGQLNLGLAQDFYVGTSLVESCPRCGRICIGPGNGGDPCETDADCDSSAGAGDGVCGSEDLVPNDGVRGGTCIGGADAGQACDVNATDATFPAPGGGAYSYDCAPDPLRNITGNARWRATLALKTGSTTMTAGIPCFDPLFGSGLCPCGVCADDVTLPCNNDADCGSFGACGPLNATEPSTECTGGGLACDGIVRADGSGLIYCLNNADCAEESIGIDAGACTLADARGCFADPIEVTGAPSPTDPTLAGVTCVARTSNTATNTVYGFPAPMSVRISTSAVVQ